MYPEALASNADLSGESGCLCDMGVVMGKYDEFFAAAGNSGEQLLSSSLARDLLAVQTGLQQTSALEEGKIYTNPGNGYVLALYNPRETPRPESFFARAQPQIWFNSSRKHCLLPLHFRPAIRSGG